MADKQRWLIYGANGYTGKLVAELARSKGHAPILAGRSPEKLKGLADKLSLEMRAFPLEPEACASALSDVAAVLHCAGPFSQTSAPMVKACLQAGVHYLDVTGELKVIASVLARDAEAKSRAISLLPAVGFDVVPSDCLALSLKEKLPSATTLELAFATRGSASPGTLKTAIEGMPEGGAIRRNGRLVRVPAAYEVRKIRFHSAEVLCMSIPWGDLASAYTSTQIPNITVFMSASPKTIRAARWSRLFGAALKIGPLRRFVQARIGARVQGPTEAQRAKANVELWGRVSDESGRSAEGTLTVPEGYTFTAASALECTLRVLRGGVASGALTPSQAFGSSFITELPGCTLRL